MTGSGSITGAAIKTLTDFPARLAGLIESAGHATPSAFSQASGVPTQTLHNLLKGHRRPTWDTVQKLAKALGVSTDVFRDKGR